MLKTINDTFKEATRIAAMPSKYIFGALAGLFGWAAIETAALSEEMETERKQKAQSKIVDRRLD